uniref:Uncharacterized protein n=1 Tax=Utricularia reniformis TaxID=192314 RepID=A0A1Y0B2E0_9LAMI|nr:hypothetical protein AEK19_MT1362 [Utricularia reniformis]ART31560.1 hypothetical protein AEK19_MT1362 [Utricularia reniformis]
MKLVFKLSSFTRVFPCFPFRSIPTQLENVVGILSAPMAISFSDDNGKLSPPYQSPEQHSSYRQSFYLSSQKTLNICPLSTLRCAPLTFLRTLWLLLPCTSPLMITREGQQEAG